MSDWNAIDPKEMKENPFVLFNDSWVVIAAQKEDKVNAMTASWGSLGVLWGKRVATVYVRESRHTHAFMEAAETFSITSFDASYKKVLNDIMGSKSGRDIDKIKECGFTVEHLLDTPVFREARLAIVCKKAYSHPFVEAEFCDKSHLQTSYKNGDLHTVYIGTIESMYQK